LGKTAILSENGIEREQVFITNTVKHVTPKNRKPLPDEIEACKPYLTKQLEIIKPEIVVLMGTVAWQNPR
jgi:uracil-DNA glycosylase family 4